MELLLQIISLFILVFGGLMYGLRRWADAQLEQVRGQMRDQASENRQRENELKAKIEDQRRQDELTRAMLSQMTGMTNANHEMVKALVQIKEQRMEDTNKIRDALDVQTQAIEDETDSINALATDITKMHSTIERLPVLLESGHTQIIEAMADARQDIHKVFGRIERNFINIENQIKETLKDAKDHVDNQRHDLVYLPGGGSLSAGGDDDDKRRVADTRQPE